MENIYRLSEVRILNMTKIYENSTIVNYNYTTFNNIFRLGLPNIPGDNILLSY